MLTAGMDRCLRVEVAKLIRYHMYPFEIERNNGSQKLKNRLSKIVGKESFESLMKMHECDKTAH